MAEAANNDNIVDDDTSDQKGPVNMQSLLAFGEHILDSVKVSEMKNSNGAVKMQMQVSDEIASVITALDLKKKPHERCLLIKAIGKLIFNFKALEILSNPNEDNMLFPKKTKKKKKKSEKKTLSSQNTFDVVNGHLDNANSQPDNANGQFGIREENDSYLMPTEDDQLGVRYFCEQNEAADNLEKLSAGFDIVAVGGQTVSFEYNDGVQHSQVLSEVNAVLYDNAEMDMN